MTSALLAGPLGEELADFFVGGLGEIVVPLPDAVEVAQGQAEGAKALRSERLCHPFYVLCPGFHLLFQGARENFVIYIRCSCYG